jgi:hypothetical protein
MNTQMEIINITSVASVEHTARIIFYLFGFGLFSMKDDFILILVWSVIVVDEVVV